MFYFLKSVKIEKKNWMCRIEMNVIVNLFDLIFNNFLKLWCFVGFWFFFNKLG